MGLFSNEVKITGIEVNYYFYCKRQLWFYTHGLDMEQNSVDVEIGKEIHDESFEREHKEVLIDDTIKLDFVGENAEIHEVKKGKRLDKGDRYQILFYIYYLEKKGIENVRAVVHFPLYKRKEELYLTDEDRKVLEEALAEIKKIRQANKPDPPLNKSACKKCSYYELCLS
ncbi:CRISPR-associated exonuclease Cas4 [Caldanaerobius fijiensis DSM 17918]|uniref:CRISPR-associated exonuclease Cas4 n=1 Tax=Caldanaerobius fijiensis DSM 17918 TaxID=1121256 RepID=A0A1M4SK76_9THEO|nr:CRISPR-associated protein Cas4 [Caldanaerobius fijiensis]SHE32610.1 CRISPR-associated exonuclease Cas4 [Caldanaerobius fijiensis DSM 17918]